MRTIWIAALAVASAGASAQAANGDEKAADKRVCRSERSTGSRIPTSECHTRAEWVEIDAARAKHADQFQRNMNNPAADGSFGTSPIPR